MASKWLTSMMVDDFIHDPVLAAEVIFGFELPPHQQLRLWAMWTSTYMIDSSGFGTGKSFTIALVACLRAILFQNRTAGIVGKTYAQGKLIFKYIDDWAVQSKIFKEQLKLDKKNQPSIVHGSDACQAIFKNENVVRVIPPDFAKDGERVASESWTDGYFDEWTRFRNYSAFNKVFLGRVRKPIARCYSKGDPVFGNHIFMSGTAQQTWHPAYAKVQQFQEHITTGDRRYEVQSWNYTHIPENYAHLDSTDTARELMMESLRPDEIEMEIFGRWVSDSIGWYHEPDIKMCRTASPKEVMSL